MSALLRKPSIALLLIALAGAVAYATSFGVPFQFDDDAYVVNNPVLRNFSSFLSPREIAGGESLSPTDMPTALRFAFMTRIFGYLTLAANFKLHGLNVAGYHIVNLLLHILTGWLLYLIARSTFSRTLPDNGGDDTTATAAALFTALLFICHPLQTHAVTYVTSRFVLLASCCSLLSLWAYIRSRTVRHASGAMITLSVAAAAAAMLSKEFTFTLPVLIALYEFTFLDGSLREKLRKLAPLALPMPIIPLLVFLKQGNVTALDGTMRTITAADVSQISRLDYLMTQFGVITLYLRLLILPVGQNIDHDIVVQHSPASPAVFVPLLVLLVLLALAGAAAWCWIRSRHSGSSPALKVITFGIAWFFIALSVESSILPLGELQAEYRAYLPSAGLLLAFGSLCILAVARFRINRTALTAAAGLLIITLTAATLLRNRVWQSEISLWSDASAKSPGKVRPLQNLGMYYARDGRLTEAEQTLKKAVAVEPRNFELHNNLGIVYRQAGDFDRAIAEYRTVLQLQPGDPMAHYNLGNIHLAQGRPAEAIEAYQSCLKGAPGYDEAYNNLGIALQRSGRRDEAVAAFRQAVTLNPENKNARNNLNRMLQAR